MNTARMSGLPVSTRLLRISLWRVRGTRDLTLYTWNGKLVIVDDGMPTEEAEVGAGHGEHAPQDGQEGVLVNVLPILRHLLGHVVHEVLAET